MLVTCLRPLPGASVTLSFHVPSRRRGSMTYFTAALVIIFGMASKYVVEMSSELSSSIFLDAEAGIETAGTVTAEQIIDMRPEAAIASPAISEFPDLLSGIR